MPKSLPKGALELWEKVYDSRKEAGDDLSTAAQKAWGAIKNAGWEKDDKGKWHKKSLVEFSLTVKKAVFDEKTQEMRWRADTSDVDDDLYQDNMSLELFADFIQRIETGVAPPPEFCSDYWKGGQPYISVSHYDDMNGNAVPGVVDATYVDGKFLKAKGRFFDTPLGRACFKSLCRDLNPEEKSGETVDRVRVSIAFLDWKHQHKSSGYVFERKSLDDLCPECFLEMLKGESAGKRFLSGHLIHYALTRVPVNTRTVMEVERSMTTRKEDAASIVGDELAMELDEKAKAVKSKALVEMSDTEEKSEVLVEEAKSSDHMEEECEDSEDKEEKKKEMMKSDAVDLSPILDVVKSLAADLAEMKKSKEVVPPTPHALDPGFAKLRAEYDYVQSSDLSPDDKLRHIQASFNALGQQIMESLQPKSVMVEEKADASSTNDIVKAFSQALAPLAQKMDLISTQLSEQKQVEKSVLTAPQRRSIVPSLNMQQKQVTKSVTPILRELIEKTT